MKGYRGEAPTQSNWAKPRSTATSNVCPTWRIAINAYHIVNSTSVCRCFKSSLCTKILYTGNPTTLDDKTCFQHPKGPQGGPVHRKMDLCELLGHMRKECGAGFPRINLVILQE